MKIFSPSIDPFAGTTLQGCKLIADSDSKVTETNVTNTTNTTETTTTQIDARKGVADQGILLEEASQLDQSIRIEQVSDEVLEVGFDSFDNLVNRDAEFRESFLDNVNRIAVQNSNLATKFLGEGKDLISDAQKTGGERLGSTAIIIAGLAISLALYFATRKK